MDAQAVSLLRHVKHGLIVWHPGAWGELQGWAYKRGYPVTGDQQVTLTRMARRGGEIEVARSDRAYYFPRKVLLTEEGERVLAEADEARAVVP